MKLVTFAVCGRDRVGAVVNDQVVDLNAGYAAALAAAGESQPAAMADRIVPDDMLAFLGAGEAALATARPRSCAPGPTTRTTGR